MGHCCRRIQLIENYEVRSYVAGSNYNHDWCQIVHTNLKIKGTSTAICFGNRIPMWWIVSKHADHRLAFADIGPFKRAEEAAVFLRLIADTEECKT